MKVQCKLCNQFVELEEFDIHYQRCSAEDYIQLKSKELYNQEIKKKDLNKLDKVELNRKYFEILNDVYATTKDVKERKRIENLLYGTNYSLKECI